MSSVGTVTAVMDREAASYRVRPVMERQWDNHQIILFTSYQLHISGCLTEPVNW